MTMEINDALARRLIDLWLAWQEGRPAHQRLFFNFHEDVVRGHPELGALSLLDTLTVLNTMAGISPQQH